MRTYRIIGYFTLRNMVLFPGVVIPITAGRDKSIKLINDVMLLEKQLVHK
jgi:ATP-dependent Lon protease